MLSSFNKKIRLGVEGRAETFETLHTQLDAAAAKIWFHCASLGEYEQGLPVFEKIIEKHPDHQVILSFFSPSGYEVKKNNSIGDVLVYLPLDTQKNAKYFLKLIDPELVIFTKYDIWPNYCRELEKSRAKTFLISALFRKEQSYFKWYGGFMRKSLHSFSHIFTQDENSKDLVKSLKINAVSVAGDTRFDRLSAQLLKDNHLSFIDTFKNEKRTVIFGSSWPDDDKLFIPFINSFESKPIKYIIAPHNISSAYTQRLENSINSKVICFSNLMDYSASELQDAKVFILDTIGYLNRAYSYADIAYVGGAAGNTGLHNILEPAVFGVPIIIGKNYAKFPEAALMIEHSGVFSVSTNNQLNTILEGLINNDDKRVTLGLSNAEYVQNNSGAVGRIIDVIKTY